MFNTEPSQHDVGKTMVTILCKWLITDILRVVPFPRKKEGMMTRSSGDPETNKETWMVEKEDLDIPFIV